MTERGEAWFMTCIPRFLPGSHPRIKVAFPPHYVGDKKFRRQNRLLVTSESRSARNRQALYNCLSLQW